MVKPTLEILEHQVRWAISVRFILKGYVFVKTVIDVFFSVTLQPMTIYVDDDRNFSVDVKYSVTVKEVGFCCLHISFLFYYLNFSSLKTSNPRTGRYI